MKKERLILIKPSVEYKDLIIDMVDEWMLFYNGFEYVPFLVSYKNKEKYDIINVELQNKFNDILKISRKING